jgi:histidinol-phosphatase
MSEDRRANERGTETDRSGTNQVHRARPTFRPSVAGETPGQRGRGNDIDEGVGERAKQGVGDLSLLHASESTRDRAATVASVARPIRHQRPNRWCSRPTAHKLGSVSGAGSGLDEDLALAHHLADEAAALAMAWFGQPLGERTKSDGSLVTDADEAVEDRLRALLTAERPGDAVLGEERGHTGTGSRRWLLDGIDGTVAFAQGGQEWGSLIALEVECRVAVGICVQPAYGRRYWGVRGRGAYVRTDGSGRPRRLSVSGTDRLVSARSYVPSEWARTDDERRVAGRLAETTTPSSLANHPALAVAEGDCDVALFFQVGPWDLAAPSIVVEEAGGRFSNLAGEGHLETSVALFSNGATHEALLAALSPSS